MSLSHKAYLAVLSLIVLASAVLLAYTGFPYYSLPLEERFFHPSHILLKPGGIWGHGMGIVGSFSIILGVIMYVVRKRMRSLSRLGHLKYWLEFHIFLCTLGPVLILFHTSFKFGGLVAVSFWSMVAVFLSGIIGRFIYLQIPHTIEGRELSLSEIKEMKSNIGNVLSASYKLDAESINLIVESTRTKVPVIREKEVTGFIGHYLEDKRTLRNVKNALKRNNLPGQECRKVLKLVRHDISLNRRIDRLVTMQNLFKYWHVAHFPFALVMLIIMLIHVGVTIAFGYRWIF